MMILTSTRAAPLPLPALVQGDAGLSCNTEATVRTLAGDGKARATSAETREVWAATL